MLAARFKVMLSDLGLSAETAAQALHVTPRTVRYWISGKTTVPYAAYRLLRVLRGAELPCDGWDGWHMHSGKLWTPEGHGISPGDSDWWGLLVRKARLFQQMYDRDALVNSLLMRAGRREPGPTGESLAPPVAPAHGVPSCEAGGPAEPAAVYLSHGYIGTQRLKTAGPGASTEGKPASGSLAGSLPAFSHGGKGGAA